ncbi:aminotransferase-like domain-containing protein [Phyllobacterium pellucidum]|uniref:aminotransferase-like domain-containing protein n=1 Tax=Phyllobacterium pellucidum TaxID=2740464 RepID=UPI001D1476F9|nr:PLP-dependent aminotransferase family protein [Phyllobacterium sp. T1018]UGY09958.1 PLP-dependent aminotransferase family protein [Phyllobacterium sp. T1018]
MSNWEARYATRANRMRASEIRELLKLLDQPDIISFAGGIPDPALFPTDAFRKAYERALADGQAGPALQYSVSEGYAPLREWIAKRLAALGIVCDIDNIVITSGSQQALDYLGKLFLSPSDTALVTSPTYLGALQAFNAYEPQYDQLTPELGNMTPAGYQDTAARNGGRPKFAYINPDFSNPAGETLDRDGRERLLDLADELDIPIIEDAAYQGLRYDGEPVPPILALDIARKGDIDATRTIYCGTFSKTLSPGLRLGFVCAAKPVIRKLVLMKQAADLHSPTINQMAMYHAAVDIYDAQIERLRATYGARRDHVLTALDRYMPEGVSWTKPEGGMFIWVTLPEGIDGAKLLARSIETERVAFVPGQAFHADGSGANTIRLSFSLASEEVADTGIARLGRLIRQVMAEL